MIAAVIAGEIAFWVVLAAGLALRYLWRLRRLSTVVLLATPLIDVALLVLSLVDLRRGHPATWSHGLAAIYIGAAVVFGKPIVDWADRRAAGLPRPPKPTGAAHAARERRSWLGHLLAFTLAAAVLGVFSLAADDPAPMWGPMRTWALVLVIDFVISFSYTLFPRRAGRAPAD